MLSSDAEVLTCAAAPKQDLLITNLGPQHHQESCPSADALTVGIVARNLLHAFGATKASMRPKLWLSSVAAAFDCLNPAQSSTRHQAQQSTTTEQADSHKQRAAELVRKAAHDRAITTSTKQLIHQFSPLRDAPDQPNEPPSQPTYPPTQTTQPAA